MKMIENIHNYISKVSVYASDRPEQTVSKTTQLFHIMSYACAEGMHVKAFFEDTDSSAPGNYYEGLSGLLGYVQAKEPAWDCVMVYDRFSIPQDVIRYTQLVEFLESYGIILISVKDGLGRDPDKWIDISEKYASQEGSTRK